MKVLSEKVDKVEGKSDDVLARMDERLNQLEAELKRTKIRAEDREKLVSKEREKEDLNSLEEKQSRKVKKAFARRTINTEDLTNDSGEEVQGTEYQSMWAKEIEMELNSMANKMTGSAKMAGKRQVSKRKVSESIVSTGREESCSALDREEDKAKEEAVVKRKKLLFLQKKKEEQKMKMEKWERLLIPEEVRTKKKGKFVNWFSDEKIQSDTDISEDSQEEEVDEWKEVNRKQRNKRRQKRRQEKKKDMTKELSQKMQHLIGIGPVTKHSIDYFFKKTNNLGSAQIMAAKEYLKHYLDFNDEDLKDMKIEDTKKAAKDDVLYIALAEKEQVREIYYRRAKSGNDDLQLRDYIPPQLHSRFTALAKRAAEQRKLFSDLKTQIRWGDADVEIHTKKKGTEDAFKKCEILEFMGEEKLPEIDLSVKWKPRYARRNLNFRQDGPALPSLEEFLGTRDKRKSLTRKHSNASINEMSKRHRQSNSMDTEDDEDENEDAEDEEEEKEDPMSDSELPAPRKFVTSEIQI